MQWLSQIIIPGGRILDPCAGSGSTGVGALLEGRQFIGIEQAPHYARVAAARLGAAADGRLLTAKQTRALAVKCSVIGLAVMGAGAGS